MRADKFLNTVNLVKRRAIAQDMCESGAIRISGKSIKPSRDIKVGEVIEMVYLEKSRSFLVLQIPDQKTIPKSQSHLYVKEVEG